MSVLQTELEGAIPSRVTNLKLLRSVTSNASVSETEVLGAIPGEAASFLFHSGIHRSQTLGHNLQHDEGEIRRLLDEKEEAAAVDRHHFAIGDCLGRGAAGAMIDEGHLSEGLVFIDGREHFAVDLESDLALTDHEHLITLCAFAKNDFASLVGAELAGVLEQRDFDAVVFHAAWMLEWPSYGSSDRMLRLCDKWRKDVVWRDFL